MRRLLRELESFFFDDPWHLRMWKSVGVALMCTAVFYPHGRAVMDQIGGVPGAIVGALFAFSPIIPLILAIWFAINSWHYQWRNWR